MYGKVARCTVAVRGHRGTIQQLYGDTVGPYSSCTGTPMIVEADPTVVKRKLAPVPDFIIVCTRTQMIVKGQLDQSRLIQLLFRRCGWFYAPLVMVSL